MRLSVELNWSLTSFLGLSMTKCQISISCYLKRKKDKQRYMTIRQRKHQRLKVNMLCRQPQSANIELWCRFTRNWNLHIGAYTHAHTQMMLNSAPAALVSLCNIHTWCEYGPLFFSWHGSHSWSLRCLHYSQETAFTSAHFRANNKRNPGPALGERI